MDNKDWKGVLIEESLGTSQIPLEMKIIGIRVTALEEEAEKGQLHFHNVEVESKDLGKVVEFVSQNIKASWYFHLVKDDEMIVILHHKVLRAKKNQQATIDQIRKYALSQGIIAEQLPLEKLFDNPYL